jgi:ABC-type nitrate/sulfonate/bicarbonate transport system permease component
MNTFLRKTAVRLVMAALAVGLIFGVWNLVIFAFDLKAYALPTPQDSVATIYDRWSAYQPLMLQTIKETVYGFLIGSAIGFFLAVVMSASKLVQRLVYPALITSQAIPIVAIAAPLAILLGFGLVTKLVIVALWVFFPVTVNVLDGLARVDRDLLNLARVMGAKWTRTFLAIQLPATLSPLFSGLKIGATYAVTAAVIGEWVASLQYGLGTYLQTAAASLDTRGVLGATILLTLIGITLFLVVTAIGVVATPWERRSTARRRTRFAGEMVAVHSVSEPDRKGVRRWFGSSPAGSRSESQSRPR